MHGEKDLTQLLANMKPELNPQKYVFVTLPHDSLADVVELKPVGTFIEPEGITAIIEQARADNDKLEYYGVFACITLTIHSSLEAVGLTAAVATALAEVGISANVVAAYYHDHIFVNQSDQHKAVEVLKGLTQGT